MDALDQMARLYSVKGGTRRWPVAVFYNLLDMAAINVYVLYKQCLDKTVSRRDFMMDLVCELYENHMNITKAAGPALPLPQAPQLPLRKKKTECQVDRCTRNKPHENCAVQLISLWGLLTQSHEAVCSLWTRSD